MLEGFIPINKRPLFLSECPKCKNNNLLTTFETTRKVHCQTCYHHYDYDGGKEIDDLYMK